jgi:hypothetical protein
MLMRRKFSGTSLSITSIIHSSVLNQHFPELRLLLTSIHLKKNRKKITSG